MEIKYKKQKPSDNFKLLNRINIIYSDDEVEPTIQVFPFKALINDKKVNFTGISGGVWQPNSGDVLIADVIEDDKLILAIDDTVLGPKHLKNQLGILIHVGDDVITILDHMS